MPNRQIFNTGGLLGFPVAPPCGRAYMWQLHANENHRGLVSKESSPVLTNLEVPAYQKAILQSAWNQGQVRGAAEGTGEGASNLERGEKSEVRGEASVSGWLAESPREEIRVLGSGEHLLHFEAPAPAPVSHNFQVSRFKS